MRSIAEYLAPLASEAMHLRYIAHGTQREYLLPEELLEDAYTAIAKVRSNAPIASTLSEDAKVQVLALAPLLAAEVEGDVLNSCESAAAVIDHPVWRALRYQACVCLEVLNFDLAAWEADQ